ncbi:MAG: aspartate/glutamate racemase family protein [Ectothiorhodospiraceae bacterium]|nr:aspartate/glutamate racemase family protein [Ectothiorhodospiraceae bacterium]
MSRRIVVLNPNSTQAVTDGLSAALDPLRIPGGPVVDCHTLTEGPPGIESDAHVAGVVEPLCRHFAAEEPQTDAFVIACFSDPGLVEARKRIGRPVYGMAECGMLTAMTRAERFGVIAILEQSIPRHLRYIDRLGIRTRLAADLPVGLGVTELVDQARTFPRLVDVGRRLVGEHGAGAVVLGCAGMAPMRAALEADLGVPVIDPAQAAVAMAVGALLVA